MSIADALADLNLTEIPRRREVRRQSYRPVTLRFGSADLQQASLKNCFHQASIRLSCGRRWRGKSFLTRMTISTMLTTSRIERAAEALQQGKSAVADRLLSEVEAEAFAARDAKLLESLWPHLAEARKLRRQRAASGRIDSAHTHYGVGRGDDGRRIAVRTLCLRTDSHQRPQHY